MRIVWIAVCLAALVLVRSTADGQESTEVGEPVFTLRPIGRVQKTDEKLPELVEVAAVESLAAAMAKIDRAFDNLKLCQEAGWGTPENHPDLVPSLQSFLIREDFHESRRNLAQGYDDRFQRWLGESERIADRLGQAVLQGDRSRADELFDKLGSACQECHAQYRN